MMDPEKSAAIPLSIVTGYTKQWPGIWDTCDALREAEDSFDKSRCYLPVNAAVALWNENLIASDSIHIVPALAAWRKSKEVYVFDKDLAVALYEQVVDSKIPSNVLMSLPFYCVYIEAEPYRFFAYLDQDSQTKVWELRFSRLLGDGKASAYFLRIGNFTLKESIAEWVNNQPKVNFGQTFKMRQQLTDFDPYSDALNKKAIGEMLQLVLYICAENADVQQEESNVKTYHPSSGKPKDRYREVREWVVGARIGPSLRKQKSEVSGRTGTGSSSKKRPHIRRGHWHHYWTGRKPIQTLSLRWVAPFLVGNGDHAVRVHKVAVENPNSQGGDTR